MHIRKTGNSLIVEVSKVINGVRHKDSAVVNNKTEAKEFEAEFLARVLGGTLSPKVAFNVFGQEYIDNINGLEPRTILGYQQAFDRIKPILKTPLNQLTNTHFVKAFNTLKDKGLAPRTILHTYRITKQICDQANLDFKITIPLGSFKKTVKLKLNDMDEAKALTIEEQKTFLEYLREHKEDSYVSYQTYIFSLIALYSGMRTGEISALSWSDINANGIITVSKSIGRAGKNEYLKEPKTKAGKRKITIGKDVLIELSTFRKYLISITNDIYLHQTSWVFIDLKDSSQHTTIQAWSNRVRTTMAKLGIKHNAHALRHTHASNLLMNNCPIVQVANRLGHSDPSITLRVYSHFLEELSVDFEEYMPKIIA